MVTLNSTTDEYTEQVSQCMDVVDLLIYELEVLNIEQKQMDGNLQTK